MEYVYVLQSKRDGVFYTGWTDDLRKRLDDHNAGKVFSTKHRKPFTLIYYEASIHRGDAKDVSGTSKRRGANGTSKTVCAST